MDEQPPTRVPPAAPPAAPPVTATAGNSFAVAALVLGILAIVLSWTVWLGVLLGILAIIFGVLGISRANNEGAPNKGMAVAGLVTGIIGLIFSILLVLVIFRIANDDDGLFDEIGSRVEYCLDNPNDPDC
jgi:uncharacterized protein DUF4190